jgi:hypothetical protein
MTNQKKLCDFTIKEVDRAFVFKSVKDSDETWFEFKDRQRTPERDKVMKQVKEFYDAAARETPNEELSQFSIQELLDELLIKAREIKEKSKAVWVVDDRKDLFEIEDKELKKNANCVALICHENNLINKKRGRSTFDVKNYGKFFNLCDTEPFRPQPVLSGWLCTGFLVKEDIIATAAHCVNEKNIRDLRIVFGYRMLDSQNAVEEIPDKNIYQCVDIIKKTYTGENAEPDWALVKLDRKVEGQAVAALSKEDIYHGQHAYVIGYPLGLPLKLAPGAQVCDISETCFAATLDIYSGNSGSPVFCNETHEVIGMVMHGDNRDFRWTKKGMLSVIYPNLEMKTRGPQCTRVSEFIDVVDNL